MKKIILLYLIIHINLSLLKAQCFRDINAGIYHSITIKSDGTLWEWGYIAGCTIGNVGYAWNTFSPVPVQFAKGEWKSISFGESYVLAIRTDGTLWGWGNNHYHQVSPDIYSMKCLPVQIGHDTDWKSAEAGGTYSLGIKNDGSLWGWGSCPEWQSSVPMKIRSDTDWEFIVNGNACSMALKKNGTLWAWGLNDNGQLGDSTRKYIVNPKQIGNDSDWKQISLFTGNICFTLGIKNNGTLWGWGSNALGFLGDSTTTDRLVPTQIGNNSDWSYISAGRSPKALKQNGTLWSWGDNAQGSVGDGTNITRYFPVQIGSSNDWCKVSCSAYHSLALKKDGTLWSWGFNYLGELGDGSRIQRSVPTLINCPVNKSVANKLSGSVFISKDANCTKDSGETGISNLLMMANSNRTGIYTDSLGNYTIFTDSGNFSIAPVYGEFLFNMLEKTSCPISGKYDLRLDGLGKDSTKLNFALELASVPFLQVKFAQTRLRRCFENTGIISYCNLGTRDTDNVKVIVQIPPDVTFVSSSNNPNINGKTLTYNIGKLKAGECGSIQLITKVDCSNGLLGQSRCFKVAITPGNSSYNNLKRKQGYDGSIVQTEGICLGNEIEFTLSNKGTDMVDFSTYRIYKDGQLDKSGRFKLMANDKQKILVNATGHTFRIEADQSPLYPSKSNPNSTIENCGPDAPSHLGFVTIQPFYEENEEYKEFCITIRDSYDPNEKNVSPTGVGTNHQVVHRTPLHYNIDFQNTGNDTAYQVVVKDTLSDNLDLRSLIIGPASHPFTVKFTGEKATVINFTFDHINLLDSHANERKSHGFITYSIKPFNEIPDGTIIHNSADIYFDFNNPIRTNTTRLTIDDRWPKTNELLLSELSQGFIIIPNPANNEIRLSNYEFSNENKLSITNSIGQIILQGFLKDIGTIIDINSFSPGIYFIDLNGQVKKLVIAK